MTISKSKTITQVKKDFTVLKLNYFLFSEAKELKRKDKKKKNKTLLPLQSAHETKKIITLSPIVLL